MYIVIFFILLITELLYFRIADKFNIIDKPNERSSHTSVVLRGGGIIFLIGAWVWSLFYGFHYPWFLAGLTLVAGVRHIELWWVVLLALIVYVGITNVINFMDGINGITAGYSLAVLIPLVLLNRRDGFVESSLIEVSILSVLVFCLFNFRPKGKAKCFAGDVGSIGIAFILLFILGKEILQTKDITYLVLLVVYGVDACLTIVHRIMLHENLGEAHRKHAYQLMANELKIGHVKVTSFYMILQLVLSLFFIYGIPDTVVAHWIYLVVVVVVLAIAYVLFMRKYYHLHAEYLMRLKK